MKKSLLVAALIAGFAGAAHAETSVTLYGILDGGIGYQKVDGSFNGVGVDQKKTGMIDGVSKGNRWGLRGTEDLGDGLQAVFVLESGFNLGTGDTSSDKLFHRQATLGLRSDAWGQLDFGRQTNIASKYFAGVASPFGTDWGQARAGTTFSSAASIRYDNMVMYQTPNFAGFQAGVGYSFNTRGNQQYKVDGNDPNFKAWTTGVRYGNGPLAAALTYDQVRTAETLAPGLADVKIKSWNLAASYDFEVVKLHAGFGQTRNGWFNNASFGGVDFSDTGLSQGGFIIADDLKVNSYTVGLSAPIGAAGKVMASWGMADPRTAPVGFNDKQHVYSLGYDHALSKRTSVYAIASYGKHVLFQDDLDSKTIGVGLRHSF